MIIEFFMVSDYLQGCMDVGRILHQLLHLLGMFHMHTAVDRDEYVSVWIGILWVHHYSIFSGGNSVGKHHIDCVSVAWQQTIKLFYYFLYHSRIQNFVTFESDVSMFGTSYDFDSVMHYPTKAFSKDGKPTILSKNDGDFMMV